MNTKTDENIQIAINLFGNQTKLANAMGVEQGHVSQWLNEIKKPSPYNAVKLNRITKGKVLASGYYPYLTDVNPDKSLEEVK